LRPVFNDHSRASLCFSPSATPHRNRTQKIHQNKAKNRIFNAEILIVKLQIDEGLLSFTTWLSVPVLELHTWILINFVDNSLVRIKREWPLATQSRITIYLID
jgi:hypothetical protein